MSPVMRNPLVKEGLSPRWVAPLDCRCGMKSLADKSVSTTLTDPPYFIDGMDNMWNHRTLRKRCVPGVVGGIPAGMKFDREQGQNLQAFLAPIAQEWMRVIKPGGFVLCFSQARLTHRTALSLEEAGFEIRDLLAWRYEGQAKAFTQDHFVRKRKDLSRQEKEAIISKLEGRKTPQLKPCMETIILAQAPRQGTFIDNWLRYKTGLIDVSNPLIDEGRFPGTIMAVPKPRERHGHMTAKPVLLFRHLIRIFTAKGRKSLVLDPSAGSGPTGVASVLEGRGF